VTDYRAEIKRYLNVFRGVFTVKMQPRQKIIDPAVLELAVARFIADQIYQVEGLGLLDDYNCTNVTIVATLEDDSKVQGSATIAGQAGKTSVNFQTGLFTYSPVDAQGNAVDPYTKAECGKLTLITHTNYTINIDCDVVTTDKGTKIQQRSEKSEPKGAPVDPDDKQTA